MNRYEQAAAKITQQTGVHVEWAPANREYVVNGSPAGSARSALRLARQIRARINSEAAF